MPYSSSKSSKKLQEWLDSSGNNVSLKSLNAHSAASSTQAVSSFKDRFMKLAKHIEDYYDWSTVYYVSECELELEFRSGYDVFNLVIDVNSTAIDLVVTNTKAQMEIVTATVGHNDWSKILSILETRDIISDKKLCEWLDSNGNKVSLNSATTTVVSDYSNIFNNLLKHIEATTGVAKIIDMKPFAFTAAVGNGNELNIARVVSSASDKSVTLDCRFRASLYNSTRNTYLINKVFDNWYSMLDALFRHGIITDKTVCESVRVSTIDEFKLYENLWELTEAKADTQRLIDFAGEDLATRFLQVKNKLKAPENDLYYWIKNKTADELEQAIIEAEAYKSNRQLAKDARINGAKLVCETAHWKVYHITTFEASQQLGRDTQWCITGINDWGDRYWNEYTSQGINFYFLITKGTYDPRGTDSKFAIADYSKVNKKALNIPFEPSCEIYNQQDTRVSLKAIPYVEEVNIPGVDLKTELRRCSFCRTYCPEGTAHYTSGLVYCKQCFEKHFFYCNSCGGIEYNAFEFIGADKAKLCRNCASKAKKNMSFNGYMYEVSCETPDGLATKQLGGLTNNSQETLERLANIYLSLDSTEKENCYVQVISSITGEVLFPGWQEPNPKGCTMETLNTIKDRLIKFDEEMKEYR
jgi:hypothetical protein